MRGFWSETFDLYSAVINTFKNKFCFWSEALQDAWTIRKAFDHKRMYTHIAATSDESAQA